MHNLTEMGGARVPSKTLVMSLIILGVKRIKRIRIEVLFLAWLLDYRLIIFVQYNQMSKGF